MRISNRQGPNKTVTVQVREVEVFEHKGRRVRRYTTSKTMTLLDTTFAEIWPIIERAVGRRK